MATRLPLMPGRLFSARLTPRPSTLPARPSLAAPRPFRPAQYRRPYSSQPTGRKDTVKFWPFILVIGLGTLGYVALVNRRKGEFNRHRLHPLQSSRPLLALHFNP